MERACIVESVKPTSFPLLTRKAARRYFNFSPSLTLEQYYHEADEMREIALATDEREAFERESGMALDSDVIPAAQFAALLSFVLSAR